jgi:hypothetical protein
MMTSRYFVIHLLIILVKIVTITQQSTQFECLISNNKYYYEFLYASDQISHVYTTNYMTINPTDNLKWQLIQNKITKDAYYIRNKRNGEYLCANLHQPFAYLKYIQNDKGKIIHNKLNFNCIWKLERTPSDSDWQLNTYFIKNVYLNEKLFAGNAKLNKSVRYVFMTDKSELTDRFKWSIEC